MKRRRIFEKYLISALLVFGFVAMLLYARIQIAGSQIAFTNRPTPTSTPSPSSTPDGVPTTKPQAVNYDSVTDCVSSAPNCKGESIRLRQSQCKNIICCGFNDGRWEVYPSREKCEQEQNAYKPTSEVQRPTQPTTGLNFYCYDNTLKYSYYTSSGEQCNKDNARSVCIKLADLNVHDPCMQKCLDAVKEDNSICSWAYLGSAPAIEYSQTLYDECTKEASQEHQTCMDACYPPYEEATSKCYNY